MIKYLQKFFVKPQAKDMAREEIEEYQRRLLVSQAQAAYHAKMAEYYQEGIARLAGFKARTYSNG